VVLWNIRNRISEVLQAEDRASRYVVEIAVPEDLPGLRNKRMALLGRAVTKKQSKPLI
jgi:hypothetical protein